MLTRIVFVTLTSEVYRFNKKTKVRINHIVARSGFTERMNMSHAKIIC